jgi:hypothetical protein
MTSMEPAKCVNCGETCNNAEYITDDRRICCSMKCVSEYYKRRKGHDENKEAAP